jgi:hypothetical protein
MPTPIKWSTPVDRGTVLTTELNGLAINGYSVSGTEIDNSANLDQFGYVEVILGSLNPTAGASVTALIVTAPNGTNYEDSPSATNPAFNLTVGSVSLATGAAAKRAVSGLFRLPPTKFKVVLLNTANVALAASGNSVRLYTTNPEF